MVEWSVAAVDAVVAVERTVVALPSGAELAPALAARVVCVAGGEARSQSVRAALRAAGDGEPVIVHDAARPLATPELFQRALAELERTGADAVIAATPVPDTIKETRGPIVTRTLDRSRLWAIQTPQVFRRAPLEQALEDDGLLARAPDDAWLIEQRGGVVRVIDAGQPNFKITTATDLELAELLLASR